MEIVIQIVGSLLVLAGFALAQWGVLDQKAVFYLVLNVAGSGILALEAVFTSQWGFLLLEGVWAIVSLVGLMGVLKSRLTRRTVTNAGRGTGGDDAEP
ncbi:CBU_0592 family membrane protein [Rathayibacter sp. CAU 1779]